MTNADRFKAIFGLYATELWAKPEKEFLKWLNADVPDTNVGDTISKQAVIDVLKNVDCSDGVGISALKCDAIDDAVTAIKTLPTVDAVPVVHGHWIKKRYWSEGVGMGESYGYWYACSECNYEVRSGYGSCDDRFCSNCGADMKENGEHGKIN